MSTLFEPINLDAMPQEDMLEAARVLEMYSEYVRAKAFAIDYRCRGAIPHALQIEEECQKLYERLPEWARW